MISMLAAEVPRCLLERDPFQCRGLYNCIIMRVVSTTRGLCAEIKFLAVSKVRYMCTILPHMLNQTICNVRTVMC